MPRCGSIAGAVGTLPRWGLRPNSPQQAAGMRTEPAPSEPSAAEASPAATAVAAPPLEPPEVRWRSQGLRVTPNVGDSVNGVAISSGTCVLPRMTAPAARSRRTTSAEGAGMLARVSVVRQVARTAGSEVRPPGSAAERDAARRLAAWLRARGDAAEVRTRQARPQAPAATGIGAAVAAAGSLLSV